MHKKLLTGEVYCPSCEEGYIQTQYPEYNGTEYNIKQPWHYCMECGFEMYDDEFTELLDRTDVKWISWEDQQKKIDAMHGKRVE